MRILVRGFGFGFGWRKAGHRVGSEKNGIIDGLRSAAEWKRNKSFSCLVRECISMGWLFANFICGMQARPQPQIAPSPNFAQVMTNCAGAV